MTTASWCVRVLSIPSDPGLVWTFSSTSLTIVASKPLRFWTEEEVERLRRASGAGSSESSESSETWTGREESELPDGGVDVRRCRLITGGVVGCPCDRDLEDEELEEDGELAMIRCRMSLDYDFEIWFWKWAAIEIVGNLIVVDVRIWVSSSQNECRFLHGIDKNTVHKHIENTLMVQSYRRHMLDSDVLSDWFKYSGTVRLNFL